MIVDPSDFTVTYDLCEKHFQRFLKGEFLPGWIEISPEEKEVAKVHNE